MQDTAKLISILHTGYTISLVLAIVFFLIAVLLFFVFDIRQVFMIRSGKAAKRDIKKLEEENFKTGRLSQYGAGKHNFNTGSFSANFDSQEFSKTEQMSPAMQYSDMASQQVQQPAPEGGDSTTVLGQNETTILNGENTTVLNAGATTVLNAGMQININQNRKFEVIKKEIYIHTEEVI